MNNFVCKIQKLLKKLTFLQQLVIMRKYKNRQFMQLFRFQMITKIFYFYTSVITTAVSVLY